MRLEKISGEGPDALYDLYSNGQLIARGVALKDPKGAIDLMRKMEELKRRE